METIKRTKSNGYGGLQADYRARRPFLPNPLIRSGLPQTLLAQVQPPDILPEVRGGQPFLLDAGIDQTTMAPAESVRLLAYYNQTTVEQPKGLVLMLHGWEGCSHSTYNLIASSDLLRVGYDVVRLNLRDHGPNLHVDRYSLNVGFFFGTLLDEVITATQQIARMAGTRPFYIVGPSMGGNFALRLAAANHRAAFHNLRKIIAISPAIRPAAATRSMDAHPLFQRYFRDLWLNSVQSKQRLYPEHYDLHFDPRASIYEITDQLAPQVSDFRGADEYYAHYAVANDAFAALNVATTIITAADDPVIPVDDFYEIDPHPLLKVHIHPSGGHVGFVDIFPLRHFLPSLLLNQLVESA